MSNQIVENQQNWKTLCQRRNINGQNMNRHSMPLKIGQLKSQWGIATQLLECQKWKKENEKEKKRKKPWPYQLQEVLVQMQTITILRFCWYKWKFGTTALENNWVVSYKIKHKLPYNPVIPLLGIYPKQMKTMFT